MQTVLKSQSQSVHMFPSFSSFSRTLLRMLKAHFDVIQCYAAMGRNFAEIKEPQQTASETFRLFSEIHRNMEKDGMKMLKAIKPVLSDLGTYLTKAIPDTKMTIRKYADAKFTYLSYCLKVKELDDEEHTFAALQDPLYRVETGNYEYRLVLRCRQEARGKFASLRNDVLEKLELLESKHAQDLVNHLRKLLEGLANFSKDIAMHVEAHPNLFPIEVDLKPSAFQYKSNEQMKFEEDDAELSPPELAQDAVSALEHSNGSKAADTTHKDMMPGFDHIELDQNKEKSSRENDLLVELGIADIDLSVGVHNTPFIEPQSCIDWLTSNMEQFNTASVNQEGNPNFFECDFTNLDQSGEKDTQSSSLGGAESTPDLMN